MAFASLSGSVLATAVAKSGSSLVLNTGYAMAAGDVVVLWIAADNGSTTDGNTISINTLSDSVGGNTWTRARAYTKAQGALNAGSAVALYYCKLASALPVGSSITINFSFSGMARAAVARGFSSAAGTVINVAAASDAGSTAANLPNQTVSDLPSKEYLFVRAIAAEQNNYNFTPTTGYTGSGSNFADGGTTDTSMEVAGEFRILSGTGDTVTSTCGAVDSAAVYVALEEVTPITGILDAFTPAAAYSTRRLRNAYTGPLLRVRRSSDNAEQNIGFTAAGTLDTTALAAFVGANSGFVSKWFDQSGNGRDLTQATAGSQPRLVNAGTLDTLHGQPCLFSTGSKGLSSAAFSLPSPWARFSVSKQNTITNSGFSFLFGNVSSSVIQNVYASIGTLYMNGPGTTDLVVKSGLADGAEGVLTEVWKSGGSYGRWNGAASATVDIGNGSVNGLSVFCWNNTPTNGPINAYLAEVVLLASEPSAGDITTLEGNLGSFWGVQDGRTASLTATLGALSATADAEVVVLPREADLNYALGTLGVAAEAVVADAATLIASFGTLATLSSGSVKLPGVDATLGALTATLAGTVTVGAASLTQFGALTAASGGDTAPGATATPLLPRLTASATGTSAIVGGGTMTLGALSTAAAVLNRPNVDSDLRCVLVEVTVNVAGVETTRYLASANYVTGPDDDPPNRAYLPLITGGGNVSETLSLDGNKSLTFGDLALNNANGEFDSWLDDLWANRAIRVYVGDVRWPRTDFVLAFDGVVADIDTKNRDTLNLKIRDKLQRLNTAVSETTLGGIGQNKDRLLPLCFGECHNVEPLLVDPANLVYQVHDGPIERVIEVRDNGVPVVFSADLDHGTFMLAAPPVGQITASVQGDKNPLYVNTISRLVRVLALRYGKASDRLQADEIDNDNFEAFEALCPQPVGLFLKDRMNVIEAIQQLAASAGAQISMSKLGKLQIHRLTFPPAPSSYRIYPNDMVQNNLAIAERSEVAAAVKIGYCKNWTVQGNLTSGIREEHKALFGQEWLVATESYAGVAAQYRLSVEPTQRDTLLLRRQDAEDEAWRLLDIVSVPRTTYKFEGYPRLQQLVLGQSVWLVHPRFGLAAGKPGVVVGLSPNWMTGRIGVEVMV